ncbi:MAG TPA: CPBP family intramembrane metalloprotease [Methylomusa anaerophila]|uniref:CAAX amino terminal protease self-immunity n=1 Tax=Methylomusa anaerophila TaxID=1930071 RepID=A0A348AMT2_9FIRM|nr:CPBP family intramembrane glutamic endopeptidase [Methylomusa anaerophila]BBB92380.1 CAAX amino terminal protease self- immunity [Methylomusa anaerophila]HML89982.1 CPBP family intramembrane metalloprotease [Methylomusa anaerophila]
MSNTKLKAVWGLKAVLSVHFLRIAAVYFFVRFVYSPLFNASPPVIELIDRIVIIALVLWQVRAAGAKLPDIGLSFSYAGRNVLRGLAGGLVLLGVSLFSERLYTTVLMLSPSQHPLVQQVEKAVSWQQLAIPLFLAGVAAPVAEEMLYRLFTFLPLKDRWGLWAGTLMSAGIFALFHFNAYWLVEMVAVGAGLALLYYWSGSLITSIVAHSFINTSKIIMVFLGAPLV